MMRSKLFVPGTRPELFSKALASEADAVCFDLEDAVLAARKSEARDHVRDFLCSGVETEKEIIVRVNGIRSAYFEDDLAAVVCPAVAMLTLPKVEDPSEIKEAAAAILTLEKERNCGPIAILATIESPRGLRLTADIAGADARVAGLQLGLADLFEPLGIDRSDRLAVHHVRLTVRLAAGEAGVPCFDCAFPDFADAEGFAAEAAAARGLGFAGKSCIHPSQIAAANRIFSPTAEEIARSLRIVEAAREASVAGAGAFALDGAMIDGPFVKRAESVIQFAKSIGMA